MSLLFPDHSFCYSLLPKKRYGRPMRAFRWFSLSLLVFAPLGCSKSTPGAYDPPAAGAGGVGGAAGQGGSITGGSGGQAAGAAGAAVGGAAGAAGGAGGETGGAAGGGAGGAGVMADRGPTTIPMTGQDPNGLLWDAASATLFIADDQNNQILTWRDGVGVTKYSDLPPGPPDGAGLGQLVRAADGTVYVTRFGYGSAGGVVFARADGSKGEIPGLDVTRRRIGLTLAPDGSLYDCYFVKGASGQQGAVARLGLDGAEPDVVTGLTKPVGVLVVGSSIYASDQAKGQILTAPLASPSNLAIFATLPSADLLTAGPEGSLYTGSTDGKVYRVDANGAIATSFSGFQAVRGTAYDPANHRLFISDHGGSAPGSTNYLQIRPVD
jgi:hypothetical protein